MVNIVVYGRIFTDIEKNVLPYVHKVISTTLDLNICRRNHEKAI